MFHTKSIFTCTLMLNTTFHYNFVIWTFHYFFGTNNLQQMAHFGGKWFNCTQLMLYVITTKLKFNLISVHYFVHSIINEKTNIKYFMRFKVYSLFSCSFILISYRRFSLIWELRTFISFACSRFRWRNQGEKFSISNKFRNH